MAGMAGVMGGFEIDQEDEKRQDGHEQNVDNARATWRVSTTRAADSRIRLVCHSGTLPRVVPSYDSLKKA